MPTELEELEVPVELEALEEMEDLEEETEEVLVDLMESHKAQLLDPLTLEDLMEPHLLHMEPLKVFYNFYLPVFAIFYLRKCDPLLHKSHSREISL